MLGYKQIDDKVMMLNVHGPQRLCMHCAQQILGDEHYPGFALQSIRDRSLGLFGADIVTMQRFMWQLSIFHIARFVMLLFDDLNLASPSTQP